MFNLKTRAKHLIAKDTKRDRTAAASQWNLPQFKIECFSEGEVHAKHLAPLINVSQ